jgi:DNA-binding ferritin-like protein
MTFTETFKSIPAADLVPTVAEQMMVSVEPEPQLQDLLLQLVALASYSHQLYAQAHLIHLNVEGPLFLPLHEFLKGQYDLHVGQVDKLAEFVRTMDTLMPMCQKGLLSAYKGFKHCKSYDTRDMLITYLGNLENYGMQAKDLGELAKIIKAPDVENYAAQLVDETFKAAWFIKSTLRNQT